MERRSERRIPASSARPRSHCRGCCCSACTNPETRSASTLRGPSIPRARRRHCRCFIARMCCGSSGSRSASIARAWPNTAGSAASDISSSSSTHPDTALPAPIAAADRRPRGIARRSGALARRGQRSSYKAINAMPTGPTRNRRAKRSTSSGNKLAYEAIRRELLRAVYSPSQLQGADGLVLAQPLQRAPGQGQSALAGRRLRGARDPAARARALSGSGSRDARTPRDAAIPGQRPECRRPHQ